MHVIPEALAWRAHRTPQGSASLAAHLRDHHLHAALQEQEASTKLVHCNSKTWHWEKWMTFSGKAAWVGKREDVRMPSWRMGGQRARRATTEARVGHKQAQHEQCGTAQPFNNAGSRLARQDGDEGGHHVHCADDDGVQQRGTLAGAQGVEDHGDLRGGRMGAGARVQMGIVRREAPVEGTSAWLSKVERFGVLGGAQQKYARRT